MSNQGDSSEDESVTRDDDDLEEEPETSDPEKENPSKVAPYGS